MTSWLGIAEAKQSPSQIAYQEYPPGQNVSEGYWSQYTYAESTSQRISNNKIKTAQNTQLPSQTKLYKPVKWKKRKFKKISLFFRHYIATQAELKTINITYEVLIN